ncbi:hypothetical protein BMS3Abin15_00138 [bacterium BMS3Abin15]|nr:hypothetical protein BMS3Abin15_00138 [bacterium BMS3Abin15]GBE39187.1 hypothetical protein BMS3Bbin08_01807 [bacterium BMS3Bbin08]
MKTISKTILIFILTVSFALVFYQIGLSQNTVEEKMALIDGNYPNKTKVARYRYLLNSLEKKTDEPKERIGDMTVKSQEILRKEYGREISLLDLLEGVNKSIPLRSKLPYANVIAAYIMIIGR